MPNNLTDTEENRLLDLSLIDGDVLSLTTTMPSDSGAGTEITGGSYSRQAIDWNAAASGEKTTATTLVFLDMPDSTVIGWNVYDSTETDRKWWGLFSTQSGSSDSVAETINIDDHGLDEDTPIVFQAGYIPSGLTAGTIYYVVSPTTDTFQVSTTVGGSASSIGDNPFVVVGRVYDIDAGTSFAIPAGSSSIRFTLT